MNNEMAYLLGMVCGNGEIKRGVNSTTIAIDIPHKKLETENNHDVRIYVKASIADIRSIVEPLIGAGLSFAQQDNHSIISFTKPNTDYLIRELLRYVGNASSHENVRISDDVFYFSHDERINFLRGFADVTGYIRRSNYYFEKHKHRVYLEVPHNWEIVADICNLLRSVDIPVQTIDWAHPNMRDGNLIKYNSGLPNFWKKEHQIKIWANEFMPIGFAVIHKREALARFSGELISGFASEGKDASLYTHKYYWEGRKTERNRPHHPSEGDASIPLLIRGKHYNSWKKIAYDLGYKKDKTYERN